MSWNETHRRSQALRDVEAALAHDPTTLPWREEYAALFGDPAGLRAFARYRWLLRLRAQHDSFLGDDALDDRHAALAAARVGLAATAPRREARRGLVS